MRLCFPRVAWVGAALFSITSGVATQQTRAQDMIKTSIPGKWIEPFVPEDLPELKVPAYVKSDALELAHAQAFSGRYKLAIMTLGKAKDADPVEAALVKAIALGEMGRKTEALASLGGVKEVPRIIAARAKLLGELGRLDEAIALLNAQLKLNPESIHLHYWLGHLSEVVGDYRTARDAYGWFEPYLDKWQGQGATAFESAEEVTLIGRSLDRWASITGAYQTRTALNNIILGMFLKAYDTIDRGYWPARVAAAEYYISHDDEISALKELKAASAKNPRDIHSLAITAHLTVASFNFDSTESLIAELREIDPNCIEADLINCRNLLQQRRPTEAEVPARAVLAKQPRHLEAMGLLAASFALRLQESKMNEVLKQVEKIDPTNASAYLEVAEQLGAMRQYPRAAEKYKIAIERAPWWTTARNGLGLLYTQSGDEDQAAIVLDAAHSLDPYNLATTNYLRLLDDLRKFARKETAHFILMYDAVQDPLIPEYFADYLESIYRDVTTEYKTEPPVKTYIEVFPSHDAFSVRTTGSPWIGTVGASTGRVIALQSPRRGTAMGSFNWAQVLRHEFTHTVTLAATDNRIAHWMTEGLAVAEERTPMRWEWVPMLNNAVKKHQLFTMDGLTWGFVRPKKPTDRPLAYAESFWICQYIEQTWGHDKVLAMLAEFKKGKEQNVVFPEILGKSLSEFQADFFAWTEKQVAGWGYDEASSKKYEELKKKGEQMIKARQYVEAVEVWKEIVKLRPVDALPHTRLAGLLLTKEVNQPQKAIEQLTILHKVELHENRYAKKIARLYRDMDKLDEAVKYGVQAVYVDPYDLDAHELLAQLYEKQGDSPGMEKEQRLIPVLKAWLENILAKSAVPHATK